ncbi:MAG: hypothetical protein JNM07_00400 [Phycisphaerae bacterium]|nr:hypothetical protein [Phycisphaerae bacterium]
MRHAVPVTLAMLTAFLLSGGCSGPLNHSNRIGDAVALESLQPETIVQVSQQGPSLTRGMNRDHWDVTPFRVPLDALEHQPTYVGSPLAPPDDTPRDRGDFPTDDTVLARGVPGGPLHQARDAGANILGAALDVALFGPRMVMNPPWVTTRAAPARSVRTARAEHVTEISGPYAAPAAEPRNEPAAVPTAPPSPGAPGQS